jgi:hypothetical protein
MNGENYNLVPTDVITFACGSCHELLSVQAEYAGETAECPLCKGISQIPMQTPLYIAQLMMHKQILESYDPSVNMKIGLPGGAEFNGQVSRSDAGKMGFTVAGAALAMVGAIFGINLWNQQS